MTPAWWLTTNEAADLAGVTPAQVELAAKAGKVIRHRHSRRCTYRRESVEAWAATLTPPFELIPHFDLSRLAIETARATDVSGRSAEQVRDEGDRFRPLMDRDVLQRFRMLRRQATVAATEPRQPRELQVLGTDHGEAVIPGLPEGCQWTWTPVASVPDLMPEDFTGCLLWAAAQSVAAGVKALEPHWTVDHFIGLADLRRYALLLGQSA